MAVWVTSGHKTLLAHLDSGHEIMIKDYVRFFSQQIPPDPLVKATVAFMSGSSDGKRLGSAVRDLLKECYKDEDATSISEEKWFFDMAVSTDGKGVVAYEEKSESGAESSKLDIGGLLMMLAKEGKGAERMMTAQLLNHPEQLRFYRLEACNPEPVLVNLSRVASGGHSVPSTDLDGDSISHDKVG